MSKHTTAMRIWSVANQKGGVGKTTSAVALAGLLVERSARTLMVDLDPHASMTSYFGFEPETVGAGVYELFRAAAGHAPAPPIDALIRATAVDQLWLMPSSAALATLDRQLGARAGMGLVLAEALDGLRDRFDRILIDCPPMLGVLMINALASCERLIIPTQTEFLALSGLERMLRSLSMIEKARQTGVPRVIVPTLFDPRTRASQACLDLLRERHGEELSRTLIPVDTQVREASRAGVPVCSWTLARRAGEAYRSLLEELLALEHATAPALEAVAT